MKKKLSNEFSKLSEQISTNNQSQSTLAVALHSSKVIKKVARVWTHIYQSQPFSGAEANVSKPIHFHNGCLTIECDSATLLSHLKFNQSYLIKQLHKYGFENISSTKLVAKHKSNHVGFPENLTETKQTVTHQFSEIASHNTLKTIEACAQTTHTPALNNSLKKLFDSLKKLEAKNR